MLSYLQILVLAIIQGACELLPVSSSAHVIAAEKLMNLDPKRPDLTMLLIMLHTGTMFSVIVYFWNSWKRDYCTSKGQSQWFAIQILSATFCTGIVFLVLQVLVKKVIMHGAPGAEVEDLFDNLPLIAGALIAVGVLIVYAGIREDKQLQPRHSDIQPQHALWIGLIQGFSVPFRGFSRSGSTISMGLILGLPKRKLEEFSFALAVILTPAAIAREAYRLYKTHSLTNQDIEHIFVHCCIGMVFSFIAGLLALKLLSRWLEGGRWKFFGFYCLLAAAGVLAINYYKK
jgi:undecaprenyl-diphosphatase